MSAGEPPRRDPDTASDPELGRLLAALDEAELRAAAAAPSAPPPSPPPRPAPPTASGGEAGPPEPRFRRERRSRPPRKLRRSALAALILVGVLAGYRLASPPAEPLAEPGADAAHEPDVLPTFDRDGEEAPGTSRSRQSFLDWVAQQSPQPGARSPGAAPRWRAKQVSTVPTTTLAGDPLDDALDPGSRNRLARFLDAVFDAFAGLVR